MTISLSLPWPFSYGDTDTAGEDEVVMEHDSTEARSRLIQLLRHYEAPGLPPPSSRIDPTSKQRERAFKVWDVWKYGALAASKATDVALDLGSYALWGPRKKSWGLEMTLITSLMRNAGKHSHLTDIATMRLVIGICGLMPTPADALVTPVTFRVRPRKLRGILADFDRRETGHRELYGEWIVGKRLWMRLQAEWKASHKAATTPALHDSLDYVGAGRRGKKPNRVVLYLHGGAYYCFSASTHRLITIQLSKYTEARVFAIDYRLAPETRFPGPLHDAVSAYLRLVEDLHIPPENILIAGDSAGGGLSLGLLMYLRDNDYPLPGGAILMSPWVDLTMSCDSWDSNAEFDVVPQPDPASHLDPVACYLGEHMEKYLTHPYASPLFGDFTGLPPLLIQCGDSEVLRDEITLLAHKASLAGVEVQHELYEDAVHVFQAFPFLEVTEKAFMACRSFVRDFLPTVQVHTPRSLDNATEVGLEREIDSEHITVVRGDGVETATGSKNVQEQVKETHIEGVCSDDGQEADSAAEDGPSWRRASSPWPSPPPSDTEEEEPPTPSVRRPRTPAQEEPRTLHRIRSSLSAVLQNFPTRSPVHERPPSPSVSTVSATPTVRNHRRTPSLRVAEARRPRHSTISGASGAAMLDNLATANAGAGTSVGQVPMPAIRRTASSHTNIADLCASWATSGPANETITYKHDGTSRSRRSSQASFFLPARD